MMNMESRSPLDTLSALLTFLGIVIGALALLYVTWIAVGWVVVVVWVVMVIPWLAHQIAIAPCLD